MRDRPTETPRSEIPDIELDLLCAVWPGAFSFRLGTALRGHQSGPRQRGEGGMEAAVDP